MKIELQCSCCGRISKYDAHRKGCDMAYEDGWRATGVFYCPKCVSEWPSITSNGGKTFDAWCSDPSDKFNYLWIDTLADMAEAAERK